MDVINTWLEACRSLTPYFLRQCEIHRHLVTYVWVVSMNWTQPDHTFTGVLKKISKQVLIFLPNITKSRIFCSAWTPDVGFSILVYRPHTHYNNHRGVWKWAFWSRKPGKEIHMQWSDLKIKDSNEGCHVELGNIGFLRSHVLKNQMASNRLLVCQFPWLMK